MSTPLQDSLITVDEFERLPEGEWRTELVRGRLVREPFAGLAHGCLASRVAFRITTFVKEHGIGDVFIATGFVLFEDPPTVRAPDVAFVSAARLPSPENSPGFGHLAPDLAVEIVSPSNTAAEILDKVLDYLNAGTRLLWVIEPSRRRVIEYRSRNEIRVLQDEEVLQGYDVLPGLSFPISEIFAGSLRA